MSLDRLVAVLITITAGMFMAIQGSLNSLTSRFIGYLNATFLIHVVGTLAAGSLVLFYKEQNWEKLHLIPWYGWLGGLLGVCIVFGVIRGINSLGVGTATTIIVAAQLLTAYIINHFGLFGMEKCPFSYLKALGILLVSIGIKLLLNK